VPQSCTEEYSGPDFLDAHQPDCRTAGGGEEPTVDVACWPCVQRYRNAEPLAAARKEKRRAGRALRKAVDEYLKNNPNT
jgi:hypothetical protein